MGAFTSQGQPIFVAKRSACSAVSNFSSALDRGSAVDVQPMRGFVQRSSVFQLRRQDFEAWLAEVVLAWALCEMTTVRFLWISGMRMIEATSLGFAGPAGARPSGTTAMWGGVTERLRALTMRSRLARSAVIWSSSGLERQRACARASARPARRGSACSRRTAAMAES